MIIQVTNWKVLMLISLINGIVQTLITILFCITNLYSGSCCSSLNIAIPIVCIISGLIWYQNCFLRDNVTYLRIVFNGVLISLSSGIIYIFYNLITIHVFYPDFIHDIIILKAKLLSSKWNIVSDLGNNVAIEKEKINIENIIKMNIAMLVFGGSVFSVIISLFLRRKI
jgi:hypothetical protein